MVNETMSTAEKPIRPTYYVRHPDGTFSIAEPQPSPDDIEAQRGTTYALCDRAHSGSCCEDPDCYRAQPAADGAQRVERMSEEQEHIVTVAGLKLFNLSRQWADNKIHSYQHSREAERIVAEAIRAAWGVKLDGEAS